MDGAERLDVLGLETDDVLDRALDLAPLAGPVGEKRAYSDSCERLVRTRPMGLAAQMRWSLMPPGSFAGERITVSAAMEPAYELGGDAYEYAVEGDTAHLAVFDAVGHDTSAGLTVALAPAGCRNSRRHGVGLVDTSETIEAALLEQFGRSRYATAIIAELDLPTGMLMSWVNRGHHPPVLIRNGQWVATLERPPTRWAPPRACPSSCTTSNWNPASGSCSTPTASPRPATPEARPSDSTASSTSSSAT